MDTVGLGHTENVAWEGAGVPGMEFESAHIILFVLMPSFFFWGGVFFLNTLLHQMFGKHAHDFCCRTSRPLEWTPRHVASSGTASTTSSSLVAPSSSPRTGMYRLGWCVCVRERVCVCVRVRVCVYAYVNAKPFHLDSVDMLHV